MPGKKGAREDWVVQNLREMSEDADRWSGAGLPLKADGTPRKNGRGIPHGWSNKGKTWEWKSKENHKTPLPLAGYAPLDQQVDSWPGPFQSRTDFPALHRTAYWINCVNCNQLFCRPVTWVKSRSHSSASGHGTGGSATFCSIACGRSFQHKPIFRVCAYCAKTFRVWANNRHKRTCCNDCYHLVMSESHRSRARMPLVAYAFERGIPADYEFLTCDFCGVGQKSIGKVTNVDSHHWRVRMATIDGKYAARCKDCCDIHLMARRKDESKMTPAQKLRVLEARRLIEEFTGAN